MRKKSLPWSKKAYSVLGIFFAVLGAVMAISAATAWHTSQQLVWQVVIYALINLLAAYGFFTRSTWLLPVFVATITGLVILTGVFVFYYGMAALSLSTFIKLVVVGGILWFIYKTRRQLQSAPSEIYIGGLFIGLLLGTMSYTALIALT